MWEIYKLQKIKLWNKQIQVTSSIWLDCRLPPVSQLVQYFNKMVGSNAWTSERAAYDTALIDALIYKGIDVSAVYDGTAISFKHKVSYEPTLKRLSLIV